MDFSLSTALLGSLLSSLVLTGAMMYLASRPDATASLRWWMAGFALLFLRYALILLKPYIGETASDFLAESSHALSALIIFVGTARMMGRRLPFWPITVSDAAAGLSRFRRTQIGRNARVHESASHRPSIRHR